MENYEAWTKDGRYGLRIPSKVLEKMMGLCGCAKDTETGGIMVGYYNRRHDCAIVTDCSGAPKDSLCEKRSFRRGVRGLQRWLMTLWNRSCRRYYLGEWHFHPFARAVPSEMDVTQMRKNAEDKSYNCPEPIMVLVGGAPNAAWSLRSFVCIRGSDVFELSKGWEKRESSQ